MEKSLHKGVERFIAEAKARIEGIGFDADAKAYFMEQEGHTIHAFKHDQLRTQGAPRHHPVWADEIRHEIWKERMANIETGPPTEIEHNFEKWPSAWTPRIAQEAREHLQAEQQQRDAQHIKSLECYPTTLAEATTHLTQQQERAITTTAAQVLAGATHDQRRDQWNRDQQAFRELRAAAQGLSETKQRAQGKGEGLGL